MSERIEWTEPVEAAEERRKQDRRVLLVLFGFAGLYYVTDLATLALFHQSFPSWLGRTLSSVCSTAITLGLLSWFLPNDSPSSCVLDAEAIRVKHNYRSCKYLWSQVRSFQIADHPTRPGLRILTLYRNGLPHKLQLVFRIRQLDESELSAFIQSRIEEQRSERLMRRARRPV